MFRYYAFFICLLPLLRFGNCDDSIPDVTDVSTIDDPSLINETDHTDCMNVSEPEVVKIDVNGSTPTRIGPWTLMRWGFYQDYWTCYVKGIRKMTGQYSGLLDTLGVTFSPDGRVRVASDQMQCQEWDSCSTGGFRRSRRQCFNDVISYCFRLRVRCPRTCRCVNMEFENEVRQFERSKWIMFAYGSLTGFVLGCIVACVCMMCMEGCVEGHRECKKNQLVYQY